jgi:hypothetical protein
MYFSLVVVVEIAHRNRAGEVEADNPVHSILMIIIGISSLMFSVCVIT